MTGTTKYNEFTVEEFDKIFNETVGHEDFVVYPDIQLTVDDIKNHMNMSDEKERGIVLSSIKDENEIFGTTVVEELEPSEDVEESIENELTDEEKREIYIQQLKESKIKYQSIKHKGKTTINQFGSDYRKKRQRKNKMAKASRKANR